MQMGCFVHDDFLSTKRQNITSASVAYSQQLDSSVAGANDVTVTPQDVQGCLFQPGL
jgi:hypothetical protein